jgi:hypothetical protein
MCIDTRKDTCYDSNVHVFVEYTMLLCGHYVQPINLGTAKIKLWKFLKLMSDTLLLLDFKTYF